MRDFPRLKYGAQRNGLPAAKREFVGMLKFSVASIAGLVFLVYFYVCNYKKVDGYFIIMSGFIFNFFMVSIFLLVNYYE